MTSEITKNEIRTTLSVFKREERELMEELERVRERIGILTAAEKLSGIVCADEHPMIEKILKGE